MLNFQSKYSVSNYFILSQCAVGIFAERRESTIIRRLDKARSVPMISGYGERQTVPRGRKWRKKYAPAKSLFENDEVLVLNLNLSRGYVYHSFHRGRPSWHCCCCWLWREECFPVWDYREPLLEIENVWKLRRSSQEDVFVASDYLGISKLVKNQFIIYILIIDRSSPLLMPAN